MAGKVTSVALGAVTGAILVTAFNYLLSRGGSSPTSAAAQTTTAEEVDAPVQKRPNRRHQGSAAEPDPAPDDEPDDSVEALAKLRQAFAAKLKAHAESSSREGWSQQTAKDFELDFSEACGEQCAVSKSDCRYETCVVTVGFDSLDAAISVHPALLHKSYRVNCAVEVVLPEAAPNTKVEASFLLDCRKILNGEIDQEGRPQASAEVTPE